MSDRRYGVVGNLAIKAPCVAVTNAAITLSGLQTVNGVALNSGDRCLVKDQADQTTNGIYYADTGSWTRDVDFDGPLDVTQGTLIPISNGLVYQLTTSNPITIGTSNLTFVVNASLSQLAASSGSSLVGYQPPGANSVSRPVQDKLQESLSAADYGIKCDGVTDDAAAWQKLIDYLRLANNLSSTNHATFYQQAPFKIIVPAGKSLISTPLVFDFIMDIEGAVSGAFEASACELHFTNTTAGLVFLWSETGKYPVYNAATNQVTSLSATPGTPGQILSGSPATGNATYSRVKDLLITGSGSGTTTITWVGEASVSAGVMTVSSTASGTLTVGSLVMGNNTPAGTVVSSLGGAGVFNLNNSFSTDGTSTFCASSGNQFSGIESRVSLILDAVTVENFHGNGCTVYGDGNASLPNSYGGADGFNFQTCTFYNCDGHGFFVAGNNSQTGVTTMCNFVNNKGGGVFDLCELGNTFIGGQASYNNDNICSYGSYYDTARTQFINCYAEDGVKHIGRDSTMIGGISNGGIEGYITTATPSAIIGGITGQLQQTPTLFRRLGDTPYETDVTIAGAPGEIFRIVDNSFVPAGATTGFGFQATFPAGGYWGNCLVLNMYNQTWAPFWITTPTSTGVGSQFGTGNPIPGQLVTSSIALPTVRIQQGSVPTTGTYAQSEIFFDPSATAGGYIGSVCTTGPGTMGTLNGGATTGSITSGSPTLTVNSATGMSVGQWITIATVSGQYMISNIVGATVTLATNAASGATAQAVAFSPAVFKTFGAISA